MLRICLQIARNNLQFLLILECACILILLQTTCVVGSEDTNSHDVMGELGSTGG